MKKMGVIKKTVVIKLTAREWEKLQAAATEDLRTVGPQISWILKAHLQHREKFQKPGS